MTNRIFVTMRQTYLLEPDSYKKISEREFWSNDKGQRFVIERFYSSLELNMTCDEVPVVDEIDNIDDGVNIIEYLSDKYPDCELDYNIFNSWDCVIYDYSNNISTDEKTQIESICHYDVLTEEGWALDDTELWVYTPMHL